MVDIWMHDLAPNGDLGWLDWVAVLEDDGDMEWRVAFCNSASEYARLTRVDAFMCVVAGIGRKSVEDFSRTLNVCKFRVNYVETDFACFYSLDIRYSHISAYYHMRKKYRIEHF
jgi:hypothetical protein